MYFLELSSALFPLVLKVTSHVLGSVLLYVNLKIAEIFDKDCGFK